MMMDAMTSRLRPVQPGKTVSDTPQPLLSRHQLIGEDRVAGEDHHPVLAQAPDW